jgi:hypothetical protein
MHRRDLLKRPAAGAVLRIPAVTLDSGRGGRAHALDEGIDVEKTASLAGVKNVLAILVAVAGMR